MWKRLQGHGRERERPHVVKIGNPTLLETTYDEERLKRNPNITDLQDHHQDALLPQPYTLQLVQKIEDHKVHARAESSVYSRPSHDLSYFPGDVGQLPLPYEDVSPPSSPEPQRHTPTDQPRRYRSMRDVSPVDQDRVRMTDAVRNGGKIPVLRRAPPGIHTGESQIGQKFWGGKVAPNSKVMWDEYSGEPSKVGKAGSVSPGSYAREPTPATKTPMGYHVSVSGPEKKNTRFAEMTGRFGGKPAPIDTKREPWSRATGRAEIAQPLRDETATRIPRKSSLLVNSGLSGDAQPAGSSIISRVPIPETRSVADNATNLAAHDNFIKPIVPLKAGRNSPPRDLTSPISPTHAGLGIHVPLKLPTPITPTAQRQDANSPDTVVQVPDYSAPPPRRQNVTTPPLSAAENKSADTTPEKDHRAPTSRFSWTTYNSATTYQHSPPPSPPPPLPTQTLSKPRSPTSTPTPAPAGPAVPAVPSILSRRRPIPHADRIAEEPLIHAPTLTSHPTTLIAKASTTNAAPAMFSRPRSPPSPTFSALTTATSGTAKALPAPPTTLAAPTHISSLESQLSNLSLRRANISRLLSDLNTSAPLNPLITDFRKAREVEMRRKAYEEELEELRVEELDLGRRLCRAWGRREREGGGGGSALWVRRVTG